MAKETRSLEMLAGLSDLLDEIERDRFLTAPNRFRERVKALDRLDAYDLDSQRSRAVTGDHEAALFRRAIDLRAELEATNSELYEGIRAAIRRGEGRDALLRWMPESKFDDELRHQSTPDGDAYDHIDDLASGVLQFATPDAATVELSSDMVAYQPTPARHIFELIRLAEFTAGDVFIDLGSGLGYAPLLVAICTKSSAVGVEIEPAYVECARRSAEELNLDNATFLAQDARDADLSSGTIFYLYTPFRGAILRTVLDRLRAEAEKRKIRLCTFGPCAPIVAAEVWLTRDLVESGQITVFRSIEPKAKPKGTLEARL